MGWRSGVVTAVLIASARVHADPPDGELMIEGSLGVGPALLPGVGKLSVGVSPTVGVGASITRHVTVSVRAASAYSSGSGYDDYAGSFSTEGLFGVVAPHVQLWITDGLYAGIGLGLAWQHLQRDDGGTPYTDNDARFGADVRIGGMLAASGPSAFIWQVEYFGPVRGPTGLSSHAQALTVQLGYRWHDAAVSSRPAPPTVAPAPDDTARRAARIRAWEYLDDATKAALRGDCATVATIAVQVRDLDLEFYTTIFALDPNVARCR